MTSNRPLRAAAAVSLALSTLVAVPAHAQFYEQSGALFALPVNVFPINPAQQVLNLAGTTLFVGSAGTGAFTGKAGAKLTADGLSIGTNGNGVGTTLFTGAGTVATLFRADIGSWGVGSMTVAGGALVDAARGAAACLAPSAPSCFTIVGNGAGSTASLSIDGAGSEMRTSRTLIVGQTAVTTNGFGTPGGTTNGTVSVTNGGTLRAEVISLGRGPSGGGTLGTERGNGTLQISGAGSKAIVTQGLVDTANQAIVNVGNGVGGTGTILVSNGGLLSIDGRNGSVPFDVLNIGVTGGRGDVTVTGLGSRIEVLGNSPLIQVGRSGAATSSFSVLAGATASSLYFNVGRDGARGNVLIDGAGSQLSLVGVGTPGNGGAGAAVGDSGGGSGEMVISNGGRLLIGDGGGDSRSQNNSAGISIGWAPGTTGTVRVTGAGSRLDIVTTSLGLAAGVPDNKNGGIAIGREAGAVGSLEITAGGKVTVQGGAVSTVAESRSTAVNVGGISDTLAGGRGSLLVSGAGSELAVTGSDRFISVGRGSGAVGTLTIADGGAVSSTNVSIGRGAGATGSLVMDRGTMTLAGQQTGNSSAGAGITIGTGGATGSATVANGSRIEIVNAGSAGASFNLGGSGLFPGGTGTLALSGGSQIVLDGTAATTTFTVGREGTGVMTMSGGSSVDVGGGSAYIGRFAGGNGTLQIGGGSTFAADYVGVGSNKTGDGGTGLLVLNGSTLTASTVEIGTDGTVSGSNGVIAGNVVLRGALLPGNSPGLLTIDGSLTTQAGSRLVLDVQANGSGFDIDRLAFTLGSTFSFRDLAVTFNFLGASDPLAFLAAGGFDLDRFLLSLDETTGAFNPLSSTFAQGVTWASLFQGATFDARSSVFDVSAFTFTAPNIASFGNLQPIPEPETWALMLAGLATLGETARRRRRAGVSAGPAAGARRR